MAQSKAQIAHKKKAILLALEQSLGVVTSACKLTGIPRRTFYGWMERDEKFAAEVSDMGEIALDFAESQLHKRIKDGSDAAVIFYLKTKGKKRGYIERAELSLTDQAAFIIEPEQKGAMKILHSIKDRNDAKTG
jgi:hypothetical protein